MNLLMRRAAAVGSVLVFAAGVLVLGGWRGGVLFQGPKPVPLTNANCSNGYVVFTWDGGPLAPPLGGTPLVLSTLEGLHAQGVFFVLGTAVNKNPAMVKQEVKDGDLVENHTWNHEDFTGQSTTLSPCRWRRSGRCLARGAAAIVKAGAPVPTLYRPPFDDVTPADNAVAEGLNERVVLSYGLPGSGIVDSQDWKGKFTGPQIAANIIYGFKDESGNEIPGLDSHTSRTYVLGYHDGLDAKVSTPAAQSLQPIVLWMNQHHFCGTTNVPNPADGGVFAGR